MTQKSPVRVLEPKEDARLAVLEAVEDGAASLVVAGGDGSVAAVGYDLPLAVVPAGTLSGPAQRACSTTSPATSD